MFKKLGEKLVNHYEKKASCSCNVEAEAEKISCCGPMYKNNEKTKCCSSSDSEDKCC